MIGNANLVAAWVGIAVGMVTGAAQGLFFHRPGWAGGYGGWPRRMMRLGHISFFGLAFVNMAFALTAAHRGFAGQPMSLLISSWLLIAGAVLMPVVCYLSAWREALRHLFFVPVGTLLAGVITFLAQGVV